MVVLSYVIGSDGMISDAKIVISSGTPDFDAQVLTNYAQRLFRPAELAGKPVASRVAMRAVFVRSTGLGLLSIERDLPVHMVSDWIKYSQYLDSQYLWSGIGPVAT
jgi:TonB family protein